MDSKELKLECIKVASSGDARGTVARAQEYYDWINEPEKKKPGPKAKSIAKE